MFTKAESVTRPILAQGFRKPSCVFLRRSYGPFVPHIMTVLWNYSGFLATFFDPLATFFGPSCSYCTPVLCSVLAFLLLFGPFVSPLEPFGGRSFALLNPPCSCCLSGRLSDPLVTCPTW